MGLVVSSEMRRFWVARRELLEALGEYRVAKEEFFDAHSVIQVFGRGSDDVVGSIEALSRQAVYVLEGVEGEKSLPLFGSPTLAQFWTAHYNQTSDFLRRPMLLVEGGPIVEAAQQARAATNWPALRECASRLGALEAVASAQLKVLHFSTAMGRLLIDQGVDRSVMGECLDSHMVEALQHFAFGPGDWIARQQFYLSRATSLEPKLLRVAHDLAEVLPKAGLIMLASAVLVGAVLMVGRQNDATPQLG